MKTVSILKMQPKLSILGLYSIYELDTMIFNQGYIPIASGAELNSIRTDGIKAMGVGTRWEGNYDVNINTTGKNRFVMVKQISLAAYQSGNGWIPIPLITNVDFVFDGNELNVSGLRCNDSATPNKALFTGSDGVNLGTIKNMRITDAIVNTLGSGAILTVMAMHFENIVISNSTCNGGSLLAIMSARADNANIENVIIDNCTVNSTQEGSVALAISDIRLSTITNVHVINSTINNNYTGTSNTNNGKIAAISAYSEQSIYSKCSVDATINGGRARLASMFVCWAQSSCSFSECWVTGDVTCNSIAAGFIVVDISSNVSNCYSKAGVHVVYVIPPLNNTNSAHGFMSSLNTAQITNCYSTGLVEKNYSAGTTAITGFLGLNTSGTVTNSYWDTQTSGQVTSAGGTGKTTTEMKEGAINAATIYVGWSTDIWDELTNADYPQLKNNYEDD